MWKSTTIITDDPEYQRLMREMQLCTELEQVIKDIVDDLRTGRCTVKEARDRILKWKNANVSSSDAGTTGAFDEPQNAQNHTPPRRDPQLINLMMGKSPHKGSELRDSEDRPNATAKNLRKLR